MIYKKLGDLCQINQNMCLVPVCDDPASMNLYYSTCQESSEVGSVARVDEYGRACPEVLQPLGRPGLGRLGLHCVAEQDGVHHGEARPQGVVGFPLTAPGVQAEGAVPLKYGKHNC